MDAPARWDLYGPIHKGLRRAHARLLVCLGKADFSRDQAPLLARLKTHLATARSHLLHEEIYIHTALDQRAPGAAAPLDEDHEHHRIHFETLTRLIADAEQARSEPAGRRLYLAFSTFVGDDLKHMAREEAETWPILCAHFSDAELAAIEHAIVASQTPDEGMESLAMMAPAVNPRERAALLVGVKANAPPEAYRALLSAIRPELAQAEIAQLEHAGLAA